jgi:hypothetical protein
LINSYIAPKFTINYSFPEVLPEGLFRKKLEVGGYFRGDIQECALALLCRCKYGKLEQTQNFSFREIV